MSVFNWLIYSLISSAFLVPREFNFRWKFISFSITDVIFLIVLLWVATKTIQKKKITLKDIDIFVFLFIGYLITIAILNRFLIGIENYHLFLRYFYSFLVIICFWIGYNFIGQTEIPKIIFLIFFLYLVLCLWTIAVVEIPVARTLYIEKFAEAKKIAADIGYWLIPGSPYQEGIVRPTDLIGGMGHLGWVSLLCVPIFFSGFRILSRKISPLLVGLCFILMITAVCYLRSRSVVIGFVFSIFFLFLFKRINWKFLIPLILAFLVILSTGLYGKFVERFSVYPQQRFQIYKSAIKEIKKNPLLGVGLGKPIQAPYKIDVIDSLYLDTPLKIGLPGSVALFGFLFYLFIKGIRYHRRILNRNSDEYFFATGVLSGLSGFFVTSLAGPPFSSISFSIFFWLLLGLYARIVKVG